MADVYDILQPSLVQVGTGTTTNQHAIIVDDDIDVAVLFGGRPWLEFQDSSKATYFSYYGIACVSVFWIVFVALSQMGKKQAPGLSQRSTGSLFLLGNGLSAFLLGHLHQNYTAWDETEPRMWALLMNVVCLFNILATFSLFFYTEAVRKERGYGSHDATSALVTRILYIAVLGTCTYQAILTVATVDLEVMDDKFLVHFIFMCIVYSFFLCVLTIDTTVQEKEYLTATWTLLRALLVQLLGVVLFSALDHRCAKADTRDCPLPASFNHMAASNVIRCLSIFLFGLGILQMGEMEPIEPPESAKSV